MHDLGNQFAGDRSKPLAQHECGVFALSLTFSAGGTLSVAGRLPAPLSCCVAVWPFALSRTSSGISGSPTFRHLMGAWE